MKPILTFSLALAASVAANASPINQQKAMAIALQYQKTGHAMRLVAHARRTNAHKVNAKVANTSPYYI